MARTVRRMKSGKSRRKKPAAKLNGPVGLYSSPLGHVWRASDGQWECIDEKTEREERHDPAYSQMSEN